MYEKELKEYIEKIKQLLTLPDYDKIDAGIELAVSPGLSSVKGVGINA